MKMSRRELLRLSSTALLAGAAPSLFAIAAAARPKVEVHFTGKHAFGRLMSEAETLGWRRLAMGDLIGTVGSLFLDTPYVSYTLDHLPDREVCIVNLQELDCVTFVETTLALARLIKAGGSNGKALAEQVQ